jgi:septum formation protein
MTTLVLASASPARLDTLRRAGFDPVVIVSDVDEDAALAEARAAAAASGTDLAPADAVLTLARAKAESVARVAPDDAVVLGCDSMLELDGEIHGKPGSPDVARKRWRAMRGGRGWLHTGHWLIHTASGDGPASAGRTASTLVHFADLSNAEIDEYVATGEPLRVAGAFTVDGLGGPFVTGIEGDFHNVVGVSLPLVRVLLGELGLGLAAIRKPPVL